MVFLITLFIVFILVIFQFNKESSEREKQNYTEDGYPKIPVLVVSCGDTPQGVEVYFSSDAQNLRFKGNGIDKGISHKDVLDITLEDVDQDISVSKFSYGKAIVGMAALGSIGAIAGLTRKEKGQKLKMLVISYKEKDIVQYMSFIQTTRQKGNTIEWTKFLEKTTNEIKQVIDGEYNPIKI
jgi:hypothetical protein